jgi:FixJ family two-component response regulator
LNPRLNYWGACPGLEVLLSDLNLGGPLDGADLAHAVRRRFPGTAVVFVTGRSDVLSDKRLRSNAGAVLAKPFTSREVKSALERAVEAA